MRTTTLVGRLFLLLAVSSSLAPLAAAAKKTKPVPCAGGRYVLHGKFLVVGPGNPNVDAVILDGKNISTGSGCSVVVGKVHATKKATSISAHFSNCRNVTGKATLKAKITNNCTTMNGVFNAHGSHINQKQFSATLSVCGDGITDDGAGEDCDPPDDTKCPGQCNIVGACLCPGGGVTTTTIAGQKPDLIPTALSLPNGNTVVSGSQVTVKWTIKNQGTGAASGNWYDYLYLSDDNTATQQDRNVGGLYHSDPLGVNATYDGTTSINIPQLAPGTYYLFVVTDGFSQGSIDESNDANNVSDPLTITITAPDLIPTDFHLPNGNSVGANTQVSVQWTVKNQGNASAQATWYDYIYLSDDNVLTQQDQNLGYQPHQSNLAPDASYNGSANISIPQKPPGTYYLFFVTDGIGTGSVYEGGQDDNNVAGPIQLTIVAPDLVPTDFKLPGGNTVSAGAQVTVQWTAQNQGTGSAAPTWYDYIYFSSDNILTQQDQNLTYLPHQSALAPNGTYNGSTSITIPQQPPGTYYLFLAVDGIGQGSVYEGGADDNNIAGPITITIQAPDLTPTAFSLPAGGTIQAGTQIGVQWTVKNQGNGPATGTWYDYVYLSDDNIFTQQDTYLSQTPHQSTLAAGASYNGSVNINFPDKPPGTYYLFFTTDGFPPGSVYEGGADDNNVAGPIQVTVQTPDLTPTDFKLPGGNTVQAGAQVSAQWTVKNQGNGVAAPTWYDYVYISDDNIFSQQDTYLSQTAHQTSLAAGASYNGSSNITIPQKPPGTYYLFFTTDGFPPGQVYEAGSDDNNSAGPIQITIQAPDLVPQNVSITGGTTLTRGTSYTFNYTVKNQGTGPAAPTWYDYVYLSTDNVFTQNGDEFRANKPHSTSLAANGTYTDAVSITIPNDANHPPGTYYLFFVTDGNNAIYEGGANDNNTSQALQITVQ